MGVPHLTGGGGGSSRGGDRPVLLWPVNSRGYAATIHPLFGWGRDSRGSVATINTDFGCGSKTANGYVSNPHNPPLPSLSATGQFYVIFQCLPPPLTLAIPSPTLTQHQETALCHLAVPTTTPNPSACFPYPHLAPRDRRALHIPHQCSDYLCRQQHKVLFLSAVELNATRVPQFYFYEIQKGKICCFLWKHRCCSSAMEVVSNQSASTLTVGMQPLARRLLVCSIPENCMFFHAFWQ